MTEQQIRQIVREELAALEQVRADAARRHALELIDLFEPREGDTEAAALLRAVFRDRANAMLAAANGGGA